MMNYKIILICCGIFTILKFNNGEIFGNSPCNNSSYRSNDFININRRQYDRYIEDYDSRIEIFKQIFKARLETIDIQLEMLIDSLKINDERLNPLEILSDFSKHCVVKHRSKIPSIISTKTNVQSCITTAKNQLNPLLSNTITIRTNLYNYIKTNFEKEVVSCDKKYGGESLNYTLCLTNLVSATNIVVLNNQKTFASQLELAQCSANSHIKKAIDCNFLIQNKTIALTSEATTLIDKCLENLNNNDDFCSNVFYMGQSHIDSKNFSMTNPFYGHNDTVNCLLIKLY